VGESGSETRRRSLPAGSPAALRAALLSLRDNPIASREWRGLVHQSRDWRLWVGLRIPKDARGWGLPAVAWFCIVPYVLWAALASLYRFTGISMRGLPSEFPDLLFLCFAICSVYACMIAVALMAPAVTRERERETWETLRATVTSRDEIALGLLVGRLGPVLLALAATWLFWALARPHYAPLLQPYAPFRLNLPQIALVAAENVAVTLALGTMALAMSARFRTSGMAIVASAAGALVFCFLIALATLFSSAGPVAILGLSVLVTGISYQVAVAKL